jgi:hypothetical protein
MNDHEWTRRCFLGASASALVLPEVATAAFSHRTARELRFKLVETAGLRRFGYPVSTILPGVRMGNHFRLMRGDKVIPAQFRAIDGPDGAPAVALDFNASPGPLTTETYVVAYGDDLEPGPEPKPGMRVERKDGQFLVSNGSSLQYAVPEDFGCILNSVRNARLDFVGGGEAKHPGMLLIKGKGASGTVVGLRSPNESPPRASVAREGPLAIALRFEGSETLSEGRRVNSVATLTFPSSKSWIETAWTVDDPDGCVADMDVMLNLLIDGSPTLVDFGAGSTVYGQMKDEERMELIAGDLPAAPLAWTVRKSEGKDLSSFAVAAKQGIGSGPAEGWAHVIDRSRCTAIAVANFGRETHDWITIGASGLVILGRSFARTGSEPPKGPKTLKFWFHFVTNPVQVGAATSPQAMLSPLRVEWEEGIE